MWARRRGGKRIDPHFRWEKEAISRKRVSGEGRGKDLPISHSEEEGLPVGERRSLRSVRKRKERGSKQASHENLWIRVSPRSPREKRREKDIFLSRRDEGKEQERIKKAFSPFPHMYYSIAGRLFNLSRSFPLPCRSVGRLEQKGGGGHHTHAQEKKARKGGREGEPMNIYESPFLLFPSRSRQRPSPLNSSVKEKRKRRIPPSAMIGIGAEGDLSSFRAGMEEPLWNERDGKRRTTLYMRGRDVVT